MPKRKPITPGTRFTRIVAIGPHKRIEKGNRWRWHVFCRCDCGKELWMDEDSLRSGNSKSCQCIKVINMKKLATTHGHSAGRKRTQVYQVWVGMRQRCRDSKDRFWHRYGGRNITVCERWQTFENFVEDMGPGKRGWTIERVQNDSGYCLQNCVWAQLIHQARNRSNNRIVTVGGKTGCVAALAEHFKISNAVVRNRLHSGWSVEDAFFKPVRARAGLPQATDLL